MFDLPLLGAIGWGAAIVIFTVVLFGILIMGDD